MARLLVVDDEANMRRVLASILGADGHEVVEADGVRTAQRAFAGSPFDLVLTDQRMADGDGLALLASCREVDPTVPVVVMTAYATVELAVEAMKIGAFDFVPKPFQPDAVRAVVRRACERTELVRENERLRGQVRRLAQPAGLLGGGAAMRAVHDLVARVAPTNATVLVQGETGTARSSSRGRSTTRARARRGRSSRSTAPASPRRSSRASSSATSAAPSPGPTAPGRGSSRRRTRGRSSSTRRGRWASRSRPSSSAS